jgi:hypothetical protein
MKTFKSLILLAFVCFSFASCDSDDFDNKSNVTVKVANVTAVKKVGTRYNVNVTLSVSGLANGETVKTVGAKVGTSVSNPTMRESRSKPGTVSFSLKSKNKYYIIPFVKTNLTSGEVEGAVKSYKVPN